MLDGGVIVGDGGVRDGGFPFPLPAPGTALFIGTNTAESARPMALSGGDIAYSLFSCYGGGVFVEGYSRAGAMVFAAMGGHNCPPVTGAILFDFTDATWKRIDPANGVAWRSNDYQPSEVNADLELALPGVTPDSVPAPAHTYQLLAALPPEADGGVRGSVVTVISRFALTNASTGLRSHRFDLATGVWSRLSTNRAAIEGPTSIRDEQSGRIYLLPSELHSQPSLHYLDPADWTWRTVGLGGYPATDGNNPTSFIEPRHQLLVAQSSTGKLRAIQLTAPASGVRSLPVAGVLPAAGGNRWVRDPGSGAFFLYPGRGQTIHRLAPPPSAPFTTPWTVSAITVTGLTLPPHPNTGNGAEHHTRFTYVPALGCFAWLGTSTSRVVLLSP